MSINDIDIRAEIFNHVSDMILDFLVYDRREDEDLPRGAIEAAIEDGTITVDEIVNNFREELVKGLKG